MNSKNGIEFIEYSILFICIWMCICGCHKQQIFILLNFIMQLFIRNCSAISIPTNIHTDVCIFAQSKSLCMKTAAINTYFQFPMVRLVGWLLFSLTKYLSCVCDCNDEFHVSCTMYVCTYTLGTSFLEYYFIGELVFSVKNGIFFSLLNS